MKYSVAIHALPMMELILRVDHPSFYRCEGNCENCERSDECNIEYGFNVPIMSVDEYGKHREKYEKEYPEWFI